MGKSAFIHLVKESVQQTISLKEIQDLLNYYQEITSKTGEQLDWSYSGHAFPYLITEKKDDNGNYLHLKGRDPNYQHLLIGVGSTKGVTEDDEQYFIQITLPEASTHGDKNKGNELAKFFAKKLEGKLQLFNERIMYYYKRKLS
ncbi:protein of unknown function [Thalassobacillus cyri]|uniref:DUF1885 family protein n=1 Tax=Thalassobacillus cyri TaxID=571932 RepID=A0A1H4GPC4_9BACI|nr:DUF1885 family protein [Thalassobacillus cyri]SEB11414.1 protein of unknown function [Thalassobacillus cyri]